MKRRRRRRFRRGAASPSSPALSRPVHGHPRRLDPEHRPAVDQTRPRLHQQSLQWIVSGYILTYGGFLLLGPAGRSAGSPRVLVTGLIIAGSSLVGGLAQTESLLIGARFAQGLGAACSRRPRSA
jgi:MFS family permease